MEFRQALDISKFGLMAAIFAISLHLSLYFTEKTLLAKISLNFIIILTIVAVMIAGVIMFRRSLGGFIEFRYAMLCGMIIFASASFLFLSYTFVLYKYIDPEVYSLINEKVLETTVSMQKQMENNQDAIKETVEEIKSKKLSLLQHLSTFVKLNVLGLFFSVFIGIFVKRSPESSPAP